MVELEPDYWEQRCNGCGTGHTNLECVTQVAANVGMTVEEAKKIFIPQSTIQSTTCAPAWTNWTAKAQPEDIRP
jgi:hypothetical protein